MTEYDIFSQIVPRGWQAAARLAFHPAGLSDIAVEKIVRAASMDLRQGGCPALPGVVSALVDHLAHQDCDKSPVGFYEVLDQTGIENPGDVTSILVRTARSIAEQNRTKGQASDKRIIALDTSTAFIENLIDTRLGVGKLAPRLIRESHMSYPGIMARDAELKRRLRSHIALRQMGAQLLEDPRGGAVKLYRSRVRKPALVEVLHEDLVASD